MPVFEEEEKCEEFDQWWIFTYGDMVTLLLVFFVLLFTFCKTDVEKFKSVAESFKPTPPGTPFFLEGQPSVLEKLAAELETVEIPQDLFVTVVQYLYALPNEIIVEGHTDNEPINSVRYPSNWELSSARASAVARFLEGRGVKGNRMTVVGFAEFRPRFRNATEAQRRGNRRIDVVIKPQ